MSTVRLSVVIIFLLVTKCILSTTADDCRCIPTQSCWPKASEWQSFNSTISGQLIADHPIAAPCYPGPTQNTKSCADIRKQYTNTTFQEDQPIGYVYPLYLPCPPVPVGHQPGTCSLGNAPVYTVNATTAQHVSAGIAFAQEHNIRLVIRDTGHDLLGRSAGYGSLQIWIRYLRTGIIYHKTYRPSSGTIYPQWTGSAFTIGGGYTWSDVYPEANKRNLVVVGGGTPTVGCIGGYMQGGGHSPATHTYGLAADQVLEAQVVLRNGSLVTASPSSYPDLFFAIRGGGPGTYGVVISTTVKAWPSTNVVAQTLAFAPLTSDDTNTFLLAVTDLYAAFPELISAGYNGYGTWSTASLTPIFGNFTTGYAHTLATMNSTLSETKAAFTPLLRKLRAYNGTSLYVSLTYTSLPSYAAYYSAFSGAVIPASSLGARASRFLDKESLSNRSNLSSTLHTLAGTPSQHTSNNIILVGGGQVARDAHEMPLSGVNPAWRDMVVHHIVARAWNESTAATKVAALKHDITYVKAAALKKLAPRTGCYMNEADLDDPSWREDFYGSHYERLLAIKDTYDPKGVFYCQTCVGSGRWAEKADGALCRV